MNTHLHVLEAYTTLLEIWPDDVLRSQLKNLVRIHLDKILDSSTYHLNLFFDETWNQKSTEYSFGHDIEAAWLLCEAAKAVGDKELINEVNEIAIKVSDVTLKEGLDIDGGLMQEGDHGKYTDTDKHWWPQAEAIVGFLNAWEISGDDKFKDATSDIWEFTKRRIIDKNGGEWWWRVNRSGTPYKEEEKAGFWKCPYHNGRACIEVMKRV
jgi:mannobiose 2-epimerase